MVKFKIKKLGVVKKRFSDDENDNLNDSFHDNEAEQNIIYDEGK